MMYQVSSNQVGTWFVDDSPPGEGSMVAAFRSQELAEEYAAWKNGRDVRPIDPVKDVQVLTREDVRALLANPFYREDGLR